MKKYNIGISVVLVLLSVLIIRSSLQSGAAVQGTAMGPGVWPMILGVAMILLSIGPDRTNTGSPASGGRGETD